MRSVFSAMKSSPGEWGQGLWISSLFISGNRRRRRDIAKSKASPGAYFLRRMREEDIPEVLLIENVSFPNPWQESTFRGEVQNESISVPLVAVHATEKCIIGYIIVWKIMDDVQINNIAVRPDYRGLGIGEFLLSTVIDAVKKEGARFISLEVRPSNIAALNLYRKFDFRPLTLRKCYYTNPDEDAVVMGLNLAAENIGKSPK
jgi:ribosomal-protein-alanine N-acetyltransferase